jgi:ferritin-like metal-binding protein YciE
MSHRETLIAWLNDAHALEINLIQVLEHRVNDLKDHPQMQAKVQEHLEETRQHADLVRACVERLGSSTSTIKSGMGAITGMFQGLSTAVAADQMVKNALGDYTSEQFEIASYQALIAGAQALGDQQTVRVCQRILQDEMEMAAWLEQQLPLIVQEYIGQQAREHGAG